MTERVIRPTPATKYQFRPKQTMITILGQKCDNYSVPNMRQNPTFRPEIETEYAFRPNLREEGERVVGSVFYEKEGGVQYGDEISTSVPKLRRNINSVPNKKL